MAPRKSTSKSSRTSIPPPITSSQPTASSSKLPPSLPPIDVPESITPGYIPQPLIRRVLSEEERDGLIHELVGFHALALMEDILGVARDRVFPTIDLVEQWATMMHDGNDEAVQREIDMGLHALETLLVMNVDKAFDKLTAWTLRNSFDVPADAELVLPWQRHLDFPRGQYIASLLKGQEELENRLEDLRTKVEQARFLSQRLESAEDMLDRRLEIAKQRKAEVGFVNEVLANAHLSPLDKTASHISATLESLQSSIQPLYESAPPTNITGAAPGSGVKAWELGRQAYLNWAVGRMVNKDGGDTSALEEVEGEMRDIGGEEALGKITIHL